MPRTTLHLLIAVLALSCLASAQNPAALSAVANCGLLDKSLTVAVDDRPNHTVTLARRLCRWKQPLVLAGSEGREYTTIGYDDVKDIDAQDQGYVTGSLASGDRYFIHYLGGSTLKDGQLKLSGTWNFTGGTGRLAGLSGHGTYAGTPTPDGGMTFEMRGEYLVPAVGDTAVGVPNPRPSHGIQ